jgi:uncharacterized surface protein with fasciclin (FAS1) repeats
MLGSFARRAVFGLLLTPLLAAGCGDDDTTPAASTEASVDASDPTGTVDGDVLETASAEGDLGTFLEATEAAGIMDGLHGTGPFTVFIPTDDAFDTYLADAGMSRAEIFGDAATLRRLVEHHIVNMNEDADMVMAMDGQAFTTAAGSTLQVTVDGDTVMVGDATIERYDITASNGVIHVIDAVLVPPQA